MGARRAGWRREDGRRGKAERERGGRKWEGCWRWALTHTEDRANWIRCGCCERGEEKGRGGDGKGQGAQGTGHCEEGAVREGGGARGGVGRERRGELG